MKKISSYLLVILFFIILFLINFTKLNDSDIFWHIKLGEYTYNNHQVLFKDIFSHTCHGTIYYPNSWLYDLILYIIYHFTGFLGISIFQGIIICVTFLILYKLIREKGVSRIFSILFLILAYSLINFRISPRPYILSDLLALLFLFLWEKFSSKNRLFLLIFPSIMLIWANLYTGFLFGLILLFILVTSSTLENRSVTKSKWIIFIFILTFFVSFFNLTSPYSHTETLSLINLPSNVPIMEHLPPNFKDFKIFFIYILTLFILSFIFLKNLYIYEIGILLVYGALALIRLRLIPLFVILSLPIFAKNIVLLYQNFLIPLYSKLTEGFSKDKIRRVYLLKSILLILVFLLFFQEVLIPFYKNRLIYEFGYGISEREYPDENFIKFLKELNIKGNLYNSYELGGFLLFNGISVFYDGRTPIYINLIDEMRKTEPEKLLEKYNVEIALLKFPTKKDFTGNLKKFDFYFFISNNWSLIKWDHTSLLYLHNSSFNQPIIERYAYKILKPYRLDFGYLKDIDNNIKKQLEEEINRAIEESPNSFLPYLLKENFYKYTKDSK